jgi:SAM-dependent methyltransferase
MAGNSGFKPWTLTWEPEHVRRFWDWLAAHPVRTEEFFSRMAGPSILAHARSVVPDLGRVIDFGAGPGYLTEHLVTRGVTTIAVDSSPHSVAMLRERLSHYPGFQAAYVTTDAGVPLADGSADTVFLVETVEHLDSATSKAVLGEIRRLLAPGGHVIITTPNQERLSANETMCPSCGCVFHTVQHVRSMSAASLSRELMESGFEPVRCTPTLFSTRPGLGGLAQRWSHGLRGHALPHLLAVARKPGESGA